MKLICFDLDGVLVDTKGIHFDALNDALIAHGHDPITKEEHLSRYDGLTTDMKLRHLGIPDDDKKKVSISKQAITYLKLNTIKPNPAITELFKYLKKQEYGVAVCSNALGRTVEKCLLSLKLYDYIDEVYTSEDVLNNKPHPEIYWKAMGEWGAYPFETVIVEDSPVGITSAYYSGAEVVRVSHPDEVNMDLVSRIENAFPAYDAPKWKDSTMNVLIPMAGAGSRFSDAGYVFPKPLIEVNNKPMIQTVVENLGIDANYIFIVQKEHREKYNLDSMLNLIAPDCTIVEVDGVTEGAACTTLLASEFIDNDKPLFIANSDQYVEWDSLDFFYKMQARQADGGIVTFTATHPKWSFAEVDDGLVKRVAEKDPISDNATVGFYYFRKGSDYVNSAKSMIEQDIRTNGEFYVAPVFNTAIDDGLRIFAHEAAANWGLGTPEDLEAYLREHHW